MKYVAIPQEVFEQFRHEALRAANIPSAKNSSVRLLEALLSIATVIEIAHIEFVGDLGETPS